MQEIVEFRVLEKFAPRLFAEGEGKRLGELVRKIEITTGDPRFTRIGELQREINATSGDYFFYGWTIRRKYSRKELSKAACFNLTISSVFEPAGEECGTKYDESTACPICGAGAIQVSDLRLDLRKVPKGKDIARTIADEWIVSQRLAEIMIDHGLTGFEFRPVRHKARYEDDPIDFRQSPSGREILQKAEVAGVLNSSGRFQVWINRQDNRKLVDLAHTEYAQQKRQGNNRSDESLPIWHQLVVTSVDAEIVPPTRVGINPFDDDPKGECRCPLGDSIGLTTLSEITIGAATCGDADIVCSRQFVGARRGLLRPRRLIFISPKFWKIVDAEKIKGFYAEIAHLV